MEKQAPKKKESEAKRKTWIQLRVTEYEKNRIKMTADRYAHGCMTTWIVHASLNCDRTYLQNPRQSKPKK